MWEEIDHIWFTGGSNASSSPTQQLCTDFDDWDFMKLMQEYRKTLRRMYSRYNSVQLYVKLYACDSRKYYYMIIKLFIF